MKKELVRPEATELNIGRELRESEPLHFGQMVRFDTFTGRIMLCRPISGPVAEELIFKPRPWRDTDTTRLVEWLQSENYGTVSRERVEAAVGLAAERNSFSSALEALDALPEWDGEERVDKFFLDVCGAEVIDPDSGEEDHELTAYLHAIAAGLFIGIIARLERPGCKLDTMVVLEGGQGIGKSTLLRVMALRDEWFSDSLPHDISNKDAKVHLRGKLIVEWPEIGQVKRSTIEALKSFLSASDDKFRPPYGRLEVDFGRQCVFMGTTNEWSYLKDETGNRRFWPVRCGRIDLDKARAIVSQLYAEARHRYRAGEKWWLSASLQAVAERQQRERVSDDVWSSAVVDYVRTKAHSASLRGETEIRIEIADVLADVIGIELGRQDKSHETRVGFILAKLGGTRKRVMIDGIRRRVSIIPVNEMRGGR